MRFSYDHEQALITAWNEYQLHEEKKKANAAADRAAQRRREDAEQLQRLRQMYGVLRDDLWALCSPWHRVQNDIVPIIELNDEIVVFIDRRHANDWRIDVFDHRRDKEVHPFTCPTETINETIDIALGCALAYIAKHDTPTPESSPDMRIEAALTAIRCELERAQHKHKPLNSLHETYAVILEEMEEFWDAVKATPTSTAMSEHIRAELVQIGAMAARALVDIPVVCDVY